MANVVKAERKTINVGDEEYVRMADTVDVVFDDGLVILISPYEKGMCWDGVSDEDAVADAVNRATEWRRHYFDRRAGCKPVLESIDVQDNFHCAAAELTMSFGGETVRTFPLDPQVFRDILRAVRSSDGNEDLKMPMDLLGTPEAPTPEEFTAYVRTAGAKALTAALNEMKDRIVFGEDVLRDARLFCFPQKGDPFKDRFEESPVYGVHASAWFEDDPDYRFPLV